MMFRRFLSLPIILALISIVGSLLTQLPINLALPATNNSSDKNNSNDQALVYTINTPKAPKNFISTTPRPDDVGRKVVDTTKEPKVDRPTTAIPDGMTTKLKGSGIRSKQSVKTLLESSICGQVPIFEKQYGQSINESFKSKTEDADDSGPADGEFRILHGIDAKSGEWPWVAKMNICQAVDECGSCTGSLINSRWIITAGHCGFGNVSLSSAKLGLYDLLIKEKSVVSVKFDKMIVHPKFNKDTLDNDLTLFRLSKPVEFNDHVRPICLIDRPHEDSVAFTRGRTCYNIGYGLTEDMTAALKLQKIEVEARNPEECNDSQMFSVHLRPNDVCIGPRHGNIGASCRGDSGGPNACYDPHRNQWFLFATVSYGPWECEREEGDKWLTVSVELARYLDWIRQTIKDNNE